MNGDAQFTPMRRTPRYVEIAHYCRDHFVETGTLPSYAMIADALGVCDNATVRQFVIRAERRGLLVRDGEIKGGRGVRRGERLRLGAALLAAA